MGEEQEFVKVHFDLPEPDLGIGGESLWAKPHGCNLYELHNSPFHIRNVNFMDIVEAIPEHEDQLPEFIKVHQRSGHKTIQIYLLDGGLAIRDEILKKCNDLGATYEGMNDYLFSLDIEPEIEIEPIIQFLNSIKEQLEWRINDCD